MTVGGERGRVRSVTELSDFKMAAHERVRIL